MQDAFLGLYRRWDRLADTSAPLAYLRVCVLNGCRTALRRRRGTAGLGRRLQRAAAGRVGRGPARCSARSSGRWPAALRRLPRTAAGGAGAPLLPRPVGRRDRRGHAASAAAPSSPRPPGRSPRSAGCSGRDHDRAGRPRPLHHQGHRGDRARGVPPLRAVRPRARRRRATVARRGRRSARCAPPARLAGPGRRRRGGAGARRLAGDNQGYPERSRGSRRQSRLRAADGRARRTTWRSETSAAPTSPRRTTSWSATRPPARRLATVPPPEGHHVRGVTAAADDRTFVVDTAADLRAADSATRPGTCYESRAGTSSPARLTRLAIPPPRSRVFGAAAVSASGRELALLLQPFHADDPPTARRAACGSTRSPPVSCCAAGPPTDLPCSAAALTGVDAQSNNGLTWVDGDRAVAFSTTGTSAAQLVGDPLSDDGADTERDGARRRPDPGQPGLVEPPR